jgi:hypothetical protein
MVVASAMQKGTSRMRASVRASSVLPEPVGPMSRMLLFSISTSLAELSAISVSGGWPAGHDALVMIVHRDGQGLLGELLPDDVAVQLALDVGRLDQDVTSVLERRDSSFVSLSRMFLQTVMQLSQM